MIYHKTAISSPTGLRGEPLRLHIIDVAERLLRHDKAEFSMRDLASEAGVSFATPFNQFGSKAAIMHAVAGRRVDMMEARFLESPRTGNAIDRVILAAEIVATVMLEEPVVNRSVMGWIGTAGPVPGRVLERSKAFFSLACGDGDGFLLDRRKHALEALPGQLAFGIRGVLSFWTAGEVPDEQLATSARDFASAMMLGYVDPSHSMSHHDGAAVEKALGDHILTQGEAVATCTTSIPLW